MYIYIHIIKPASADDPSPLRLRPLHAALPGEHGSLSRLSSADKRALTPEL